MSGRSAAQTLADLPGASPEPNLGEVTQSWQDTFLVVAIGASAGGLEAFRALLKTLPADSGMAFVLVQHLDPSHDSLLVNLLSGCTPMPLQQAAQGMPIEPGHIYVIPPGDFLAVHAGLFNVTAPDGARGARLPFDFLLRSLAVEYKDRAACIVLSGTGSDGTAGLQVIKAAGGLVIAQSDAEASYDGMPASAIATDQVDLILPTAEMAAALINYRDGAVQTVQLRVAKGKNTDPIGAIIDLVRRRTPHDFSAYKPGTLTRRIERRMAMASIKAKDTQTYLAKLNSDPVEVEELGKDLLIHVTSFFRDPKVFDLLARTTIPALVAAHPDAPTRIWVAGCSTGEEVYSIGILCLEALRAAGIATKPQIFASDIDAGAIAIARDGLYPTSIASELSPERLAAYFVQEPGGFRVSAELRATVVFTVHDLLADPPFSRLDMVSCRNLLIYLGIDAQAKAVSLFHFALRPGGVLLLGKAETTGYTKGQFEPIAKGERLYRQIGIARPGEIGALFNGADRTIAAAHATASSAPSRQGALANLCREQLFANFMPAAALVNGKHELLYLTGAVDSYLSLPVGHATQDLLAMVPGSVRVKLRSAIRKAALENTRVSLDGGHIERDGRTLRFKLEVQPVRHGEDTLCVVCFIEKTGEVKSHPGTSGARDRGREGELERELEATKAELRGAILDLKLSGEEQKAINEDALSVNEEFQSTNEELLTSKEELQSLNEELTALNSQLQETLERQRTTSDDLQNVLYSTDLATLFLDRDLRIRFFTPATKLLFHVLPSDVGRPLADLSSHTQDDRLLADAKLVLSGLVPIEQEIQAEDGLWFVRRILPYRAHEGSVEGVVVTYTDITERKHVAGALEEAKQQADTANRAKSRFLAVASHDLRQPLQALSLLQGLLAKLVETDRAKTLVSRLDETLAAMAGMLNTLLDINQIEAGTLKVEKTVFPVNDILARLKAEFSYQAKAQGLELITVRSSLWVDSDPRLLEQMIRNMLGNALKYTKQGKVLFGCRRSRDTVRIEIWDSGVGIPASDLGAIFDEYSQIDNAARERSRGLGLGLSIVKRLGGLMGHAVGVKSRPGRGSVFLIEASRPQSGPTRHLDGPAFSKSSAKLLHRTGSILVVDDDPDIRELLEELLEAEGHTVVAAVDGVEALELLAHRVVQPDIVLSDFNLPGGMNGLELATEARGALHRQVAVAILTGDISTGTLRDIAQQSCVHLSKPVQLHELTRLVQGFLASAATAAEPVPAHRPSQDEPVVYVVDDDDDVRRAICSVLEDEHIVVQTFHTAEAFLHAFQPGREACLLVDAYLPGMGGLDLLHQMTKAGHQLPTMMITGHSDVAIAVQAMKAGASEFIEKPIGRLDLLAAVSRALVQAHDATSSSAWRTSASAKIAALTSRQHEILDLVLAGHPSKNIAADLGISQRTVENHRASIMKKTGAKSLPALARLALAAA
jgi:two-component system CheB/CheR fusion protein